MAQQEDNKSHLGKRFDFIWYTAAGHTFSVSILKNPLPRWRFRETGWISRGRSKFEIFSMVLIFPNRFIALRQTYSQFGNGATLFNLEAKMDRAIFSFKRNIGVYDTVTGENRPVFQAVSGP